ncbi:thermonuclease family protein [Hyphomonas sp. WL0036]|uniref:thermonuclease family protein n=1 Tax=Hyphomonas sediminis TaxID=2866160 RepID=UPI001C7F68E7|nr:thermonuclease family protein [Hyphomonas sediminis]MBY9065804.1 thermonuclease family protein [Hyphomonas sediminis]
MPDLKIALLAMAALLTAACGGKPVDPLDGLAEGERGRVVRVIDGDALVLSTGQSVRLIGIEAPAGPSRGSEGDPGFEDSKRALEDMALGREVELRYGGLTRDRYDRALAHVMTIDTLGPKLWLNAEMVKRGVARVRVYPDTAIANAPLLPMEADARAAKAGLWARRAWAITDATRLPDTFEGFQIVEGISSGMQGSDARGASCDVFLERSLLVLEIETSAAKLCQLPPEARVRVRGYVRNLRMEINHELNVELLEIP